MVSSFRIRKPENKNFINNQVNNHQYSLNYLGRKNRSKILLTSIKIGNKCTKSKKCYKFSTGNSSWINSIIIFLIKTSENNGKLEKFDY